MQVVRLTRHNYQKLPCLLSLIPVVLLLYVHICGFYAFLLRFSCNYTHKYYIILSPLRWLFLHALPVTKVVVALVFHGLTLLSHFWLACGGQRIHWSSFVWVENCSPESYCFPAWQKIDSFFRSFLFYYYVYYHTSGTIFSPLLTPCFHTFPELSLVSSTFHCIHGLYCCSYVLSPAIYTGKIQIFNMN